MTDKEKRVIVCGSRGWGDKPGDVLALSDRLASLSGVRIVHGAAKGADRLADHEARANGVPVERHRAQWSRYGSRAGHIRNDSMLESGADLVLAFWDGHSPGTRSMIEKAVKRGIPVEVVTR